MVGGGSGFGLSRDEAGVDAAHEEAIGVDGEEGAAVDSIWGAELFSEDEDTHIPWASEEVDLRVVTG